MATKDQKKEDIIVMKKFLNISPQTAGYIWELGYHKVEDIAAADLKPEELAEKIQNHITRVKPAAAKFNYKVACRRIIWAACATEDEREKNPQLLKCKEWSNKRMIERGLMEEQPKKVKKSKSS